MYKSIKNPWAADTRATLSTFYFYFWNKRNVRIKFPHLIFGIGAHSTHNSLCHQRFSLRCTKSMKKQNRTKRNSIKQIHKFPNFVFFLFTFSYDSNKVLGTSFHLVELSWVRFLLCVHSEQKTQRFNSNSLFYAFYFDSAENVFDSNENLTFHRFESASP